MDRIIPPAAAVAEPLPDAAALAHSRRLTDHLCTEIDAGGGTISFRHFMELALYAPGLGYYSAGAMKFGAAGDFVTAPELSPLFSICLARQCEEILQLAGGDIILEFGAGSGRMAGDLLRELIARGSAPREYWIIEPGAGLRERQAEHLRRELPEFFTRIRWLDHLPDTPLRGVILANEVLDAMPVHRIRYAHGSTDELCVARGDGQFQWHDRPAEGALETSVRGILGTLESPLPDGYQTEINMETPALIGAWADVLESGAILLLDYGYPRREFFHPQRSDGTLLCHYRHRVHSDPFLYPGLQDISAAVDFTAVAEAGADAGLEVRGFTSQAHFLFGCGLEEVAARWSPDDTRAWLSIAQQVKWLTLPGEMGEQVKAIALARRLPPGGLKGFSMLDQRQRL